MHAIFSEGDASAPPRRIPDDGGIPSPIELIENSGNFLVAQAIPFLSSGLRDRHGQPNTIKSIRGKI